MLVSTQLATKILAIASSLVQQAQSGYIVAANVHVIMTAYKNHDYRQVLANAEIVTPDGMPLVWAMRSLGAKSTTGLWS